MSRYKYKIGERVEVGVNSDNNIHEALLTDFPPECTFATVVVIGRQKVGNVNKYFVADPDVPVHDLYPLTIDDAKNCHVPLRYRKKLTWYCYERNIKKKDLKPATPQYQVGDWVEVGLDDNEIYYEHPSYQQSIPTSRTAIVQIVGTRCEPDHHRSYIVLVPDTLKVRSWELNEDKINLWEGADRQLINHKVWMLYGVNIIRKSVSPPRFLCRVCCKRMELTA